MTEYAIDEAWARAAPNALPPEVTTISGYLSFDQTKNLTRANIDGYHAAGRSVLLNWEASSGGALNAQNGQPHGDTAVSEAKALGAPAGVAIVFSDDTDSHISQVLPYYRMVSQVVRRAGYRVGAYGGADVVQGLLAQGLIDVAWVAAASSWSHGVAVTTAHLQQLVTHPIHIAGLADGDFDVDIVLRPIPGLWTPTGATTGAEEVLDPNDPVVAELKMRLLDTENKVGALYGATFDFHNQSGLSTILQAERDTQARLAAVATQLLQAVSADHPTDPAGLADSMVAALGPAVAKDVLDEMAKRLAATPPASS